MGGGRDTTQPSLSISSTTRSTSPPPEASVRLLPEIHVPRVAGQHEETTYQLHRLQLAVGARAAGTLHAKPHPLLASKHLRPNPQTTAVNKHGFFALSLHIPFNH